jgi:hypothetical protein
MEIAKPKAVTEEPRARDTRIAKFENHIVGTAYEPRNFDEAMRIATVYASSHLLGEINNPEAAFLIMAVGADIGISATTALRAIHIIKGKPIMSSDLLVALCVKRTDVCEYFICVESTEQHAIYETKRRGVNTPVRNTFSIADARRARLEVDNPQSNWGKYPKAMLRHRCAAELARQVYPDIVLGLYSEAEEDDLRGDETPPPNTTTIEPIAEEEPISKARERWQNMCRQTIDTTDKSPAERARREVKQRLSDGDPNYKEFKAWYTDAILVATGKKKREDVAWYKPGQEPAVDVAVTESEPGSDG